MCGIAGLINFNKKNPHDMMGKMLEQIINRGPDGFGIWDDNQRNVVLGHRRLAIIDISSNGAQPMTSHNGRYVLTYNGEIYNFLELAEKLKKDGFVDHFVGTSDTEVLLEAIAAYGLKDTLSMAKGMFAIAVYDRESGEIQLARDRIGEKPLYYGCVNNSFVFGSDIRSFECIDGFDNEINTEALCYYFRSGTIAAPNTIYKDINKLEPGTILKIKPPYNVGTDSICEAYWSLVDTAIKGSQNRFKGSRQEAAHELERLLVNAIKGQCISDVPLGAFLSAGVDSSTIVSLMQEISSEKVKTFTIGVDDPRFNEADIAAKIAEIIGTQHTELYITADEMMNAAVNMVDIMDEPFADSSQIPSYFVSKLARQHVTVSLSGDGADELFGGYGTYRFVNDSWNKVGNIPYIIRKCTADIIETVYGGHLTTDFRRRIKVLKSKGPTDLHITLKELDCLDASLLAENVIESNLIKNEKDVLSSPFRNAMLFDMCNNLHNDILTKVDRTAMAVSLESRIPVLDKDVVEFAWTLPDEYLYQEGKGKIILRDILYKRIPKELIERPKRGFSIPLDSWLKERKLREWAEELLSKETIQKIGILDYEVVNSLWQDYCQKGIWRPQIWYLLMLVQWMEKKCH